MDIIFVVVLLNVVALVAIIVVLVTLYRSYKKESAGNTVNRTKDSDSYHAGHGRTAGR
ncbi:hypothetical protein [Bifidobacterium choloepi]|uniref:hypothetical protein n=1 Tax=Bifidobacterium choloepi TaxID=2614131 RepID=UPI0013D0611A|nr:hypothetical protein [Bifidobacterium choloepi]